MKAKKTNTGYTVFTAETYRLCEKYLENWRTHFAPSDANELFVGFNGKILGSDYVIKIMDDNWTEKVKFRFTDIRKSSHTDFENRVNDDDLTFAMGQGHTYVFYGTSYVAIKNALFRLETASRHYILSSSKKAVQYCEQMQRLLAEGLSQRFLVPVKDLKTT